MSDITKKEMLMVYKKALKRIAKIKLPDLRVDISFNFKADSADFIVTVFNEYSHNASFNFYDFQTINDIESRLELMYKKIESGDIDLG